MTQKQSTIAKTKLQNSKLKQMKTPTYIKRKRRGKQERNNIKQNQKQDKHTTENKNKTNIRICNMKSKKDNRIKQKQQKQKTNSTKDKGEQTLQQQITLQTTDETKMKMNTKPRQN